MHRSTWRPAAVAGTFYPASREAIEYSLRQLIAEVPATAATTGSQPGALPTALPKALPKALIVPHAGWIYSGPTAARAFALLANAADVIDRVVLVGPAHRVWVEGLAAPGATAFTTPLGEIPVDLAAIQELAESGGDVRDQPSAHAREHCIEVEIPFLQFLLPRARIVPLLVSDAPPEVVGRALERLWGGSETLIIISSDLSHYLPYETARLLDRETTRRIGALIPVEAERACGAAAINGLLWVAARKGLRPRLLDLRSSGDTAGGRDEVVGYAAFALDEVRHDAAD